MRRESDLTLAGDVHIRHTEHPRSTFPHHFSHYFAFCEAFQAAINCHERARTGTVGVRWGCPRGGCWEGSRRCASGAIPGRDAHVSLPSRILENGLGTGGATPSIGSSRPGDGGTAKYLFVGLCLSQRAGAAGSERALPPGDRSIALERELEQRPADRIGQIAAIFRGRSVHPSSQPGGTCAWVGETPDRLTMPSGRRDGADAPRRGAGLSCSLSGGTSSGGGP